MVRDVGGYGVGAEGGQGEEEEGQGGAAEDLVPTERSGRDGGLDDGEGERQRFDGDGGA